MNKISAKSLKGVNQPKLITFVLLNAVILALGLVGIDKVVELLGGLMKGDLAIIGRVIGLPAVVSLAVGTAAWAIPRSWKETLVFWRVGDRSLPSSEAFSHIAPADLRTDMAALVRSLGTLPTGFREQGALWYATYRRHAKEAAVIDSNGAYLLYRDMTALTPLLLVAALVMAPIIHAASVRVVSALAWIVIEYVFVMMAGRNAGRRLVASVLAIESAAINQVPVKAAPKRRASPKAKPKTMASGSGGSYPPLE